MSTTHDNIADLGPETETQQITKFVDDVEIEAYEKPMMSSATAWTKMAEDSKLHDIHAILQRPVNVLEGEFNNTFSPVNLKFPDIILQKSANVVNKLNYFTYFRANVKVKLIFNATPFMSGKYWMFFAPFDAISNRGARLSTLPNNTGFPGIEIDMATNAPVEIKIPYCAPLSHYNLLDTHSNMGELYIVPINAVQSGVSPLSVGATFTIFSWFEDIELALPTSLPVQVPALRQIEDDVTWKAQVGKSEEHAVTTGPPISGVANAVAGAASSVGGSLPILGKWLRPVEWVSRAIGGAASALGWNKPTNLDKNCPYINVPAKGYTNADGIDMSSKLAAMPDNGVTYDGGIFSTDVDEMDIPYVASKSCIFRSSIGWDINDAVGTTLHRNVVNPGMCTGSQDSLNPTTLAFVSSMFRYWRGTLKYRLAVAKTAFHTGRLRITYHPGSYYDPSGTVNENAYNWILDLSVSSELEFEIPYIANVPWKETLASTYDDANNWRKEKFSTGTITVEVLTQLRRASASVADNCPFNMWISGGDDISFAVPDFGNFVIASPTLARVQEDVDEADDGVLRAQGATLETCVHCGRIMDPYCYPDCPGLLRAQVFNLTSKGVEHNEQTTNTASLMFPMSNMSRTSAEELTMGEKITSLRQLIKRFAITSKGYSYPYRKLTSDSQYALPGPIPLNTDKYLFNELTLDPAYFGTATGSFGVKQSVVLPQFVSGNGNIEEASYAAATHYPARSPLYYISYLYRFYRGGRRYKVATPSTNGLVSQSSGFRPAGPLEDGQPAYVQALDSVVANNTRPEEPLIVKKDWNIVENGDLSAPSISTFLAEDTGASFEHYNYADLNGTLEFEVPYYGQTPISLVGEGTLDGSEGPLVRRSKIRVRRSEEPRGMDRPMWTYSTNTAGANTGPGPISGGIRNCFGAYTLYEAAADDFSFGYLIGAPRIQRIQAQP